MEKISYIPHNSILRTIYMHPTYYTTAASVACKVSVAWGSLGSPTPYLWFNVQQQSVLQCVWHPLICVKHLRKLHVISAHSLLHAYFNAFPEVEFSPSSVDLLIRIQTKSCFFLPYYLSHTKMLFVLLVFIASSTLGSQGITRWHGVRTHTQSRSSYFPLCVYSHCTRANGFAWGQSSK